MDRSRGGVMNVRQARIGQVNTFSDRTEHAAQAPQHETDGCRQKKCGRQQNDSRDRLALIGREPRRQHCAHRQPNDDDRLAVLPQLLETVDDALVPIVVADRAQFFGHPGVTRQPDAADAHAALGQPVAKIAHLVWSSGETVNQQRAHAGAVRANSRKEKLVGVHAD